MSTLVNLTPHPVHLCDGDGAVFLTVPPEPTPARCAEMEVPIGWVTAEGADAEPLTLYALTFGETQGLPPPADGTYLIVSRLVAEANADRGDLLIPHQIVRTMEGAIVGCRAFSMAGAIR